MTLSSIWNAVKIFMGLSVAFALIAVGVFLLQISAQTKRTLAGVDTAVVQLVKDVDDIKIMTNATLFQGEEVLHHADVLLATENQAQKQQLAKINQVLEQLQLTVKNLDKSQQLVAGDLDKTLHQTTLTVQSLQPLTEQLTATTKSLQDTVQLTQPLLKNTNDILSHVNAISADAQTEVHNIVYPAPKPWYAKMWGVTKLAMRMLTIPLK